MSDANLRQILPESNSIIDSTDKIIVQAPNDQTYITEFGNVIFDRNNFELANTLESNILLAQQISGDVAEYVDSRINIVVVPEVLCLYLKEFTNETGLTIGQQTIATTNLSLNYFQVSTIAPPPIDNITQFSVDASGLENSQSDEGINISPGIYKVECSGSFTLAGPAGSFNTNGTSNGNGDRGYLTLELYKDTEPNESLLVSTPIIDYAPEVTLTAAPSSWCGTQAEWEAYLKSNYEMPATGVTYMYGFISICKTSNIKLKAHTAGTYIVGYPSPDSESELPPSLYNPLQIVFEKITDNPFEFEITGPEVDVLSTVPQNRTTTTTTRPTATTTLRPILTGGPPINTTPTPPPRKQPSGERLFTGVGAHTWIVPNGVTSIDIVAVGAGGGGAATNDLIPNGGNGGDLRWRNNIKVTPGSKIWVDVGAGGTSYRVNIDGQDTPGTDGEDTVVKLNNQNGLVLLRAAGGRGGRVGNVAQPANKSSSTDIDRNRGIGGGNGGRGGRGSTPEGATAGGGGGGAGGYTSAGGNGGNWTSDGQDSNGGGGGGGSGGKGTGTAGGGGGGVGLYGIGVDGIGGNLPAVRANGNAGRTGSRNLHRGIDLDERKSFGFNFGGGGGGKGEFMGAPIGLNVSPRHGGNGAVRIIWGENRSFPRDAE
jgi:hypothetical protein